jgi:lipopolysaccharide export system permease protein
MNIIDRYLLRQFAANFLICFVSLTGLYIVIDAFQNLDDFVDYQRTHGNLLSALASHYAYKSLAFFDLTSGNLCLTASMFTITWFQRHNEMTALMAAGVSRWRVLVPILAVTIVVSVVAATNRELVMPQLRSELSRDAGDLDGSHPLPVAARYDSDTNILLDGREAVAAKRQILDPSFALPNSLSNYGRQLSATKAEFLPPDGQRPSGYLLSGVSQPTNLHQKRSLGNESGRILFFPGDTQGLAPDQVFVASRVTPELLTGGSAWYKFASTRQLVGELRSPSIDTGSSVRVTLHRRLLQPFMDVTLLMLGLPLVVARGNRNPFVAIGFCVAVVAAYFLVTLTCQSLGTTGWLRPSLASWLPLVLFVPIAAAVTDMLRR